LKLIHCSDWHIRSTIPLIREDSFIQEQFKKVAELVSWSNQYQAPILCAGDMLDSNRISFSVYNELQRILLATEYGIYVIRGNHDAYFHSDDVGGTPLIGLHDSGAIKVIDGTHELEPGIILHGCGFGAEPGTPVRGCVNILMVHIPVFCKRVPHFMEDGILAADLETKFPGFDLYLAGDIHEPCSRGKVNVSGSMTRTRSPQKDFKPRAYLIDLETGAQEKLYFTIREDVFKDVLTEEIDGEYSQELKDLVRELRTEGRGKKIDFRRAAYKIGQKDENILEVLKEIFNSVEG